MTFSSNLRFLRKKFCYSQEYIAERLGYKSFTTVQKWESGISEPSVAKLKTLADLFHVSMDELLNKDLPSSFTGGTEEGCETAPFISDSKQEQELLTVCRLLKSDSRSKLCEYARLLLREERFDENLPPFADRPQKP